jgi:hypothetical protein
MRKILVLIAVVLVSFTAAQADTLGLVTSRLGSDSLDWGQLGAPGTVISNPFTAVSVGGIVVTGTFAGTTGLTEQQHSGVIWNGNFTLGDHLVWANDESTGGQAPLSLAFSQGLNEVGTQIQADYFGAFTAEIDAYNGATLLGSFTENGNSTSAGDGSAIDIGVMDLSGSNITSVTLSMVTDSNDVRDLAINQLDLNSATTPEPGTIMLLGSGLGLVGFARRRLSARFK